MESIVKIFQIDSDEKCINISDIEQYEIKNFGNGFFISKDGCIASVAHLLINEGTTPFAFYNGKFYKIEIVEQKLTEKNEDYIDAAIGKIDISNDIEYFNPNEFKDISIGINITLVGHSRKLNNDLIENKIYQGIETQLVKIHSFCFDTNYSSSKEGIIMSNFFSFFPGKHNLYGLSGSPIFNKKNKIVGILKGGAEIGAIKNDTTTICQALHIKIISKILRK